MIKPYYEENGITIYNGDCREILPSLGYFDLLLTDPPYGIGESKKAAKRTQAAKPDARWRGRVCTDYETGEWDNEPVEAWMMELARSRTQWQIIFGGNYYVLPPTKCLLIWDKENGNSDFADCEIAWTNFDKATRRLRYLWNGFQKAMPEARYHPTQKPLAVISWVLRHAPEGIKTIIDPWAGSGTIGVAAKNEKIQCTLIEREEKYCEIAVKRLAQGVLDFAS